MKNIFTDPWAYISTGMIIAVQWVMAHVNVMVGLAMGIGGIVTLIYRIKNDRIKAKISETELKTREIEHEIKRRELEKLNP